MNDILRYSERIKQTELLGPGKRSVIWVFGCCFDCEGCIARNFRYGEHKEASPQEMAEWFLSNGTNELTISGGEPMLQAKALADTIELIRQTLDTGVIIYTGFVYDELLKKSVTEPDITRLLSQTDILIDGPYINEKDNNEPYRGSSNQRIIQLSGRYAETAEEYYSGTKGRRIEIILNDEKTMMVGVPAKEQAQIWQNIKALSENQQIL